MAGDQLILAVPIHVSGDLLGIRPPRLGSPGWFSSSPHGSHSPGPVDEPGRILLVMMTKAQGTNPRAQALVKSLATHGH